MTKRAWPFKQLWLEIFSHEEVFEKTGCKLITQGNDWTARLTSGNIVIAVVFGPRQEDVLNWVEPLITALENNGVIVTQRAFTDITETPKAYGEMYGD